MTARPSSRPAAAKKSVRRRPGAFRIVERKLGRERALGQSIHGERLIEIDPRQHGKSYLDTLVHEALHLVFPDLAEREVGRAARRLTEVLWTSGYRRTPAGSQWPSFLAKAPRN